MDSRSKRVMCKLAGLAMCLGLAACATAPDIGEPLGAFSESVAATTIAYESVQDTYETTRRQALLSQAGRLGTLRAGSHGFIVSARDDRCFATALASCELGLKEVRLAKDGLETGSFLPFAPKDDDWRRLAELNRLLALLQAYAQDIKSIAEATTAADVDKQIVAIEADVSALIEKAGVAPATAAASLIGSIAQRAIDSYIERKKLEAIKAAMTLVDPALQDFAKKANSLRLLKSLREAVGEFYSQLETNAQTAYREELSKELTGRENRAVAALDAWVKVNQARSEYVSATGGIDDDPIVKIAEAHRAMLDAIMNDDDAFGAVFQKLSELKALIAALGPVLKQFNLPLP